MLICITERNNDCVIYTFISVIKCCCILFIGCTRKRNCDRSACNCVIFLCTFIILGRLDGNKLCFCGIATCFISVKCRCTREELKLLDTIIGIFVCSVEEVSDCKSEVIVAQSNHTSVNIRHRNRTVKVIGCIGILSSAYRFVVKSNLTVACRCTADCGKAAGIEIPISS